GGGVVRSPAVALAAQGPGARGAAPSAAVSRAVCRLERAPLLPLCPPRSRGDVVLQLREAGTAGGRLGAQGPRPGPASPPARAPAVLRRVAAPRRQSTCVAAPGPRRATDPHRRARRRHQAPAVRAALARRNESRGDDGPPRGVRRAPP